ncbi:MAG: hypothetical protein FH756_09185 [Firmicutes bacterium]|nr:hypothetical protein [Bacillota bacterium]
MTWLKSIFTNNSNHEMEQEQLLYQLRQAQNETMEMGTLLSQVTSGQVDSQQVQQLDQLNDSVGGFLQRLRQRIDREIK